MKYRIFRTDTADAHIHRIVLYIAEKFGPDVALEKLDELESNIKMLADDPYIGEEPRYTLLKRQGYRVLVTEKDLVFYKVDESQKRVTVYTVVDQRQDYLRILRGI